MSDGSLSEANAYTSNYTKPSGFEIWETDGRVILILDTPSSHTHLSFSVDEWRSIVKEADKCLEDL